MAKRKVHELLDGLLLVLSFDVHHDVQYVPVVLKYFQSISIEKPGINDVSMAKR